MKDQDKVKRIQGILKLVKFEDERTSKKTLLVALKEIDEICKQDTEES
jgi:hypothetical protein